MRSSFWLSSVAGFGDDLSDETYYATGTPEMPRADPEALPPGISFPVIGPVLGPPAPGGLVSAITPGAVSPAAPQTPASIISTPPTASTSTASPWSSIGSAFSDIFGNLAKNVLPGVVNRELGVTTPGQTPGIVPNRAGSGVTAGTNIGAANAASAARTQTGTNTALIIAAVAIGAILLMKGRK